MVHVVSRRKSLTSNNRHPPSYQRDHCEHIVPTCRLRDIIWSRAVLFGWQTFILPSFRASGCPSFPFITGILLTLSVTYTFRTGRQDRTGGKRRRFSSRPSPGSMQDTSTSALFCWSRRGHAGLLNASLLQIYAAKQSF